MPQNQEWKNKQVGLLSVNIYNQFFNISSANGNNQITLIWNANSSTNYTITFDDGYYSISDMNYFVQNFCIENGLYMIDNNTSDYIYFVEFLANATQYKGQFNVYALVTSAQATTNNWSIPSSATWSFPATAKTPQMTWNTSFGKLIGFSASTKPSSIQSTDQQFLSDFAPVLSVVNSIVFGINMVNNFGLSNRNDIFGSIPLTNSFGALITMPNTYVVYSDIAKNIYQQIEITLYDQNLNTLSLIDTDALIVLSIIDKPLN